MTAQILKTALYHTSFHIASEAYATMINPDDFKSWANQQQSALVDRVSRLSLPSKLIRLGTNLSLIPCSLLGGYAIKWLFPKQNSTLFSFLAILFQVLLGATLQMKFRELFDEPLLKFSERTIDFFFR